MFHSPLTSIYLGILGFSVLVAGLDFVKRRAGHRILEAVKPPTAPDPQPAIAEVQANPVAESRTVPPNRGVAYLPDMVRTAPRLPLAGYLALPKPNPGVPRNPEHLPKFAPWPASQGMKS